MKTTTIIFMALLSLVACKPKQKSVTTSETSAPSSARDYGSPNLPQEFYNNQTFLIEEFSTDPTYGYTQENPVMVGGAKISEGPLNERRFLNALAGPNGEKISYYRIGSCCPFKTNNSEWNGMLDKYNVSYSGLKKDIVIFINMYDSDTLKVPVGFTLAY